MLDQLTTMIADAREGANSWRTRLHERRDTAVLLLGWVGAMRRSEIAALRLCDVKAGYGGQWTMTVARSKTDQGGSGQVKALPAGSSAASCPPCAYLRWMACVSAYDLGGRSALIRLLAGKTTTPTQHVCRHLPKYPKPRSPIFRSIQHAQIGEIAISADMVHTIVRRRLAASFPDLPVGDYGAHSLRAGFVTEAFMKGMDERKIMRQTGQKSISTVLAYAREKHAYDNNAATTIGL